MQYMFVLFFDESYSDTSPDVLAKWNDFEADAEKVATQIAGGALQGAASATVVSVPAGKAVVTDGPFIDSKEQLGGYYVFDCENLDVALELAKKVPCAEYGHVEVRPMIDFSALAP